MRRMTLGAGCGYRGSDPQRSVHVPWEALAQHLPRGRHLHPALPRGQSRDPLHGGPGPGRQVAGGQAVLRRPRQAWGGGKNTNNNRPSKFVPAVNLNQNCNDMWHWVSHHFVTGWMSVAGIGDGSGRLSDGKNIYLNIASSLVIHCLFTTCPCGFWAFYCPDFCHVSGIFISVSRSNRGRKMWLWGRDLANGETDLDHGHSLKLEIFHCQNKCRG